MKTLRMLAQLIRADFLERTRRYSFLVTLGVMLYVGYVLVPAADSGALTVDLGNLRGVYNSAWIGSMIALLSSMLLSLPGFYLVKNGIARDRETGVGQIIATTPLRKALYTLGKTVSNFIFLTVIIAVVAVAAGATQFIRGEALRLDVWGLVAPFLFVTLPTMALVAAVAVLFETIPFLRGGFGNIAYFALYIVTIIVSLSGATFSSQGVIEQPINDLFGTTVIGASMGQAAHAAFPDRSLDFGVGYTIVEGPIQTFCWEGVTWTSDVILGRLLWVGVALGIALLAALFFDRFDPARSRPKALRRNGFVTRVLAPFRSLRFPRLDLRRFIALPRLPLPPFGRVLLAELRLTLKGLRWWWYLVALGLIVAGLRSSDAQAQQGSLLAAWIWPVLVWSKLGVREKQHHTEAVIFSAPHPLRRQFPATWLAGVIVTVLAGSGVGVSLLLAGEWSHLLAWGVAALFVPTLALTLGIWSGSSKFFEALYVVWWYIGPVSGLAAFDFMGATQEAIARGMPSIYLGAAAALLGLAALGRARQIRR
ncbi:MAG: hypothetical protein DRI77_06500 [Chloroflexi bacterium]|nr:MAG: hypothetical protein DRI77_06500 [Chloroflexota bacterium]